jgi:hypothetical protein
MIPSGRSVIDPGDRIIIFAKKQAIPKLEKILTVKPDYNVSEFLQPTENIGVFRGS